MDNIKRVDCVLLPPNRKTHWVKTKYSVIIWKQRHFTLTVLWLGCLTDVFDEIAGDNENLIDQGTSNSDELW